MKTSSPLLLTSAVTQGVVPMPRGLHLAEGTAVIILPVQWLNAAAGTALQPSQHTPKAKHRFASEDLIGCHEGDGKAATTMVARTVLAHHAER